jgi:hypothetical protein
MNNFKSFWLRIYYVRLVIYKYNFHFHLISNFICIHSQHFNIETKIKALRACFAYIRFRLSQINMKACKQKQAEKRFETLD